jgi:elongation factor 3
MRALGIANGLGVSASDSVLAKPNEVVSTLAKNYASILPACTRLAEAAQKESKEAEADIVNALHIFEALASELMPAAEPFLCQHLDLMLNLVSHKSSTVREAATSAVTAVSLKSDPNAVPELLKVFFAAMDQSKGWQTRVLALKMIASFSDHAPEQLGQSLPEAVPHLTAAMSDPKKEVKEAVRISLLFFD